MIAIMVTTTQSASTAHTYTITASSSSRSCYNTIMGTTAAATIATATAQQQHQPSNERAEPFSRVPEFDRVLTIFDRVLAEF